MSRIVIVPDETFEPWAAAATARVAAVTGSIRAENLAGLLGGLEADLLAAAVHASRAHELLLWARSERGYGVARTTLTPTEDVVGAASADPDAGLVSEVFDTGRPAVGPAHELRAEAWTNLERRRGRPLASMAGGAVAVAGKRVAVLTLAQYGEPADAPPLDREEMGRLATTSALLGRLLEDRLLRAFLGINL